MAVTLDGRRFRVAASAPESVIDQRTEFYFAQQDDVVSARYAGGRVRLGFLIGRLVAPDLLRFSYVQAHADGEIASGASESELRRTGDGRIEIVERYRWSDGRRGENVLAEISR